MDISQQILSDITIFNKYAKFIPEAKRRENWQDLCERNMSMHIRKYPLLREEIKRVYKEFVIPKKVLPSMRSMQFSGSPIELSNNRMYNCAFLSINNSAAFWETMFLLLGGSGVGFSVQQHHIAQLPIVIGPTEKKRRFLVGDSIEGWADAVKVLVRSYFENKSDPVFDFRDIRKKGAKLITSGGKAPGPDPLRICLDHIRSVFNGAIGRKLTSLECHDIMCHIADAVLSGGIRRAALISLFSEDDLDMLSCKSGSWWELNPQRGRANNSVVLKRGSVDKEEFFEIWQRVKDSGAGEPGIFWTNDYDIGTNPCVTGDTLVDVIDHNAIDTGKIISTGISYKIPMKLLVELYETSTMPPMILSYNKDTQKIEYDFMDAAALTRKTADVIKLTLDDGTELKLTPDHKVYTENRGWIEAVNLSQTDVILKIE